MLLNLIPEIRKELKKHIDLSFKESSQRFSKHPLQVYGVRTTIVRKTGKAYWKEISKLPRDEVWKFCDALWQSGYQEEAAIACIWAEKLSKRFELDDINIFEKWIDTYVSNWAQCDALCNHPVGNYIEKFPEQIELLKSWTQSPNLWKRRAAAVSLIIPARKGLFLNDIFEIADLLLHDKEDLVQKGYGWMLKSASQASQANVYEYVTKRKANMPRTALRYAIEKMPKEMRSKAMAR